MGLSGSSHPLKVSHSLLGIGSTWIKAHSKLNSVYAHLLKQVSKVHLIARDKTAD